MECSNDRKILFLLKYKEKKSRADLKEMQRLESLYPDNESYEDIRYELIRIGFLNVNQMDGIFMYTTSDAGIKSIKKKYSTESESKWSRRRDNKFIRQRTMDIISIIGGICGIAGFIMSIIALCR